MVPYAESVNIPLIIRWPGRIPAGATSDAPLQPYGPHGHPVRPHRPATCRHLRRYRPEPGRSQQRPRRSRCPADDELRLTLLDYFQTGTSWPEWRGVRTQQYTYVKWLTGREELYDNADDSLPDDRTWPKTSRICPGSKPCARPSRTCSPAPMMTSCPAPNTPDWYDDQRNLIRTAPGPNLTSRPPGRHRLKMARYRRALYQTPEFPTPAVYPLDPENIARLSLSPPHILNLGIPNLL